MRYSVAALMVAALLAAAGGTAMGQKAVPGKVTTKGIANPQIVGPGVQPAPDAQFGIANPLIVGPDVQPATNTQFGIVVAIYYDLADGETYICTGTLMTPKVILTAGHCGCGFNYRVNFKQATRFTDTDHREVEGTPILFDQRVCRDGYLGGGNDLALIRLRVPLEVGAGGYFGGKVWDLRPSIPKGARLTVAGYGYTSANTIGVRGKADIPVYSFACEDASLANSCAPFSEMILAESGGGGGVRTDTCGGDSGGPVFWSQEGRPRLIAVTSRAAPGLQDDVAHHCGGGGIYTLLGRNSVQQWLEMNGIPKAE
jgi:hypothetical protein